MQHRPVPHAGGGRGVGRIENGLQFVSLKVIDQPLLVALARDGIYLFSEFETGRNPVLEIAEEGLERREPKISRANGVFALCLQIVEEVENELRGELLDPDPAGPDAQPSGGEADQQFEGEGIAFDRMPAGAPVARQVFAEERGDVGSELGHGEVLLM